MNERRNDKADRAATLDLLESTLLNALDVYLPSVGHGVETYLPAVKKGAKYILKLIRDMGHKDAEAILDRLLKDRMEKL